MIAWKNCWRKWVWRPCAEQSVHAVGRRAPAAGDRPVTDLEPSFILLDEPFSGIDPLTVGTFQESDPRFEQGGHRRAENGSQRARNTDRHRPRLYRNQGKYIAKGHREEFSSNPEVRRVYLGDHFRLN